MEMDNTTAEILNKIELNLGVGKDEIIFNQSELDENPAKKSAIDWLKDVGVFTDSYTITDSDMDEANLSALDMPPPPKRGRLTYDPDPQSTLKSYWEAQKEYAKELSQRKKQLRNEFGKINWRIVYLINKDQFLQINRSITESSDTQPTGKKPRIQYKKGRLIYGKIAEYSPNKDLYRDVLDFLWPRKQIRNLQGEVLPRKSGNPCQLDNVALEITIKENGREEQITIDQLKKVLSYLDGEIGCKMPIRISQKAAKALLILTE